MQRFQFAIALACLLILPASAQVLPSSGQRLSLGIVVGGYGNTDFDAQYEVRPGFLPYTVVSEAGGYIVGPTLQLRVRPRVSLGVEALYKPLHYKDSAAFQDGVVVGFAPATVVTWQFPILASYRLSLGRTRPFLEAGPSFRTTGNRNASDPSHFGFSAGLGAEADFSKLKIAPRARYTRWSDDGRRANVHARADQLEFLVSFTF